MLLSKSGSTPSTEYLDIFANTISPIPNPPGVIAINVDHTADNVPKEISIKLISTFKNIVVHSHKHISTERMAE